jgi:aminoglycoside 2'-N-acetyltransferase I
METELLRTADLEPGDRRALRRFLTLAWQGSDEPFSDTDRDHASGGTHVLIRDGRAILAHGAVVPRRIWLGKHEVRAGYVEAVATHPGHRRGGLGTAVMRTIGILIEDGYELGVLSTSEPSFYARLGWSHWTGPTFVRRGTRLERSPDEDGGIWILRTSHSPDFDRDGPIACEDRPGDAW